MNTEAYKLAIPQECGGCKVDGHVEYDKNGILHKGYIYCFRQFGYNWFAWVYHNRNIIGS